MSAAHSEPEIIQQWRQDVVFDAELRGFPLKFQTTWGIFSPKAIDDGTTLLLEYLEIADDADCFDLGCGYGPLGLTMAKMAPNGQTLMVDRDFIAVEYANKNAKLNQIANAQARLGNGFDGLEKNRCFDVIVSNIPAKVGKEMLNLFLYDARQHLKPGGSLYVVTINGLRQFMKRCMNEQFGDYKKLKQGKDYTVARSVRSH